MKTFLSAIDEVPKHKRAIIDDFTQLSFGELRDRARRVARAIRRNYGKRRCLLVPANRDVEFVTNLLGVMYSGNVPVPFDPLLPPSAVEYLCAKCEGTIVETLEQEAVAAEELLDGRDNALPAMVLFTSGTSGYPKGVLISQNNLAQSCRVVSGYLAYREYDSAAVVLPLHYSYALLSQVCSMLYVGGCVRVFADLRNPFKFAKLAEDAGLATFCGVPSTYKALATMHALKPFRLDSVQIACSAGAAMDRELLGTVKKIFPNAVFFDNYGMTEATPRISYIREDDPNFGEPTCGRPIEGLEVRIVDPDSGRPLNDGEPGILALRGPNVTSGYINDSAATAMAFTEDGFLLSGDLAYLKDGYIYIVGRHDDVFNVGGEKVAPLEIERALETHEAVKAAGVIGVADPQRGSVPVAFLEVRSPVLKRDLVSFLKDSLPPGRIPVQFFEIAELPTTSNGKLQRRLLTLDDENKLLREIV